MNRFRVLPFTAVVVGLLLSSCASFVSRSGDEEKARLYLQKATDEFTERQYAQAIESTRVALKYEPEMPAAYNHLALIYMEMKRYAKSEEAFRKALSLQAQYPEVFNNLGVLLNREEKYGEAIQWFEKALNDETYSTPENAYTNMGYAYFKLGNLVKAKAYHQKALDSVPQFCLAAKNLGDVYAKEKNYARAADYFQRAVTNCPLYQESQYKLGLALMKMGQRNVARAQLEKLVERHKTGPYVERSHEVLKYLH
jgi:type IV pilus biogenesis/stability protein PilW